MKPSICLGNCSIILHPFSEQETFFFRKFLTLYPELICQTENSIFTQSTEILIKKVEPIDNGTHFLRNSFNQVLESNVDQERKIFLYEAYAVSFQKLFFFLVEVSSLCHLSRNSICFHSAAVGANNHNGFLFLGDSGNGKSTVSHFCNEANHAVLGDDANFVIANSADDYSLHFSPTVNQRPYPYSRQTPDLNAIFVLAQDTSDFLIKLPPHAIAARLFRSFQELYTNHGIPDQYQQTAFHICCNIARKIPGYELHFTKSNQFLKTIQAEFPDAF